jgi:hypothetical protein
MSVGDIRSFLVLAGYYWRFIDGFWKISKTMTELLKNDRNFKWTPACEPTDDRSNIDDARYGEVIFYLL